MSTLNKSVQGKLISKERSLPADPEGKNTLVLTINLTLQGGRYALLAVVPRARDGLTRLIADLPATSLSEIQESLQNEELDVSLPTFYVETTTKPVAALAKVRLLVVEKNNDGVQPQ